MRTTALMLAAIAIAAPTSLYAQVLEATPQASVTAKAPASVSTPTKTPEPLALDELADLHGKQGVTTNNILSSQELTAISQGNTINANTVTAGQISIGPGAFDGFAGVGNFVINSGQNNNLQGALTVNIQAPVTFP
ncbi:hypothetical protein [Brevundimonas sp. PAMC22021]|uniref:hypothetical protein n=1 Tax=Brevundimonas sp. PAMC22021 TaxID=2861285 RepID=UPI001C62B4A3|nr:hypothetical protein [Brevundimonas sp. PAMC22021]QYF86854.1 hypothetical protein KY493_13775 [Brevundimonas sp. PAMC22021]